MSPDPWYVPILNTLLSALVGAGIVYYFGIRHLDVQRKLAFRERQLAEFYAPLAGLRRQIEAKSELRLKVSNAANAAWQDLCALHGTNPMLDHDRQFEPFKKIIDYENDQLKAELIPKYREILAIFTERYHLASPDTRTFYQDFLEFVEIWNRWLAEALPPEALKKLGHSEERVKPFYEHLESKMSKLQDEIARG